MIKRPKFIVFDLDYTLWPFYVDSHVTPPFKKDRNGRVVDSRGKIVSHYPDVPRVLQTLANDGYILGVASRTAEIDGANQLLQIFDWNKYFTYKEIYPGCKKTHFNQFTVKSGIPFEDMLFFDDENRNIQDLTSEGVTAILVKKGVDQKVIEYGLETFKLGKK